VSKYWAVQPLYTSVVETLLKKNGNATDTELYTSLKKTHKDLSQRELNKTLMMLEVEGVIQVFNLTKNKRRVEIRRIRK
jgi:Fe2+ or Zn2+ uptake regulation protein